MWIWLDSTGKVKQYLMHGPSPVVGETDFQIFAHFEGLDYELFDSATIKFRKPDRQGNAYPTLFMRKVNLPYMPLAGDTGNTYFEINHEGGYWGFLFDFSKFTSDDEVVRLLDTPGVWQATITCLSAPTKTNVSGLITFTVGASASDSEDPTELALDQILENLVLSAMMLKKNSNAYLRVSPTFVDDATVGTLDPNMYSVGSVVYDTTRKSFYKILTVTTDEVLGTTRATYEKAYRSVKVCEADSNTTMEEAYAQNDGDLAVFKTPNGGSVIASFYEDGVQKIGFEAVEFLSGNRYAGSGFREHAFLSQLNADNMTVTPLSVLARDVDNIHRLAPPYVVSNAYVADDIVLHDGTFYRCVNVNGTTGTWTAADWAELDLNYIMGKTRVDEEFDVNSHQPISNRAVTLALRGKVDKTTKVNNHGLDQDVNLIPDDLGMERVSNSDIDDLFGPNE